MKTRPLLKTLCLALALATSMLAPAAQASDSQAPARSKRGCQRAEVGDWIIKGVKGEFYPCKDDIFKMTYDEVTE